MLYLQLLAIQCANISGIMHKLSKAEHANKPIASYSTRLMDAMNMGVHSFAHLHQVRKESLHTEYGNPLAKLCTWNEKVGETTLFEGDILKKLKVKRLLKKPRFQ